MTAERVVIACAGVALVAALAWGGRVLFSPQVGEGQGLLLKNSGDNRVVQRQQFEALYAELTATDAKITAAAIDTTPGASVRRAGLVSHCLDVTAQYNALGRAYVSAEFRPKGLPAAIDTSKPATDCKGGTK